MHVSKLSDNILNKLRIQLKLNITEYIDILNKFSENIRKNKQLKDKQFITNKT